MKRKSNVSSSQSTVHATPDQKTLPSMEKLWSEFSEEPWILSQGGVSMEQAINNISTEKKIPFQKLERNFMKTSCNILGIQEGDTIEGIGSSSGMLMKMHWMSCDEDYVIVPGENTKRLNNQIFFSPCKLYLDALDAYFEGTDYLEEMKSDKWNPPGNQRKIQRAQFEEKLVGSHIPHENKISFLKQFADNLPNHRDIGGNDTRFRWEVFRLPDAMVDDLQFFFGEQASQMINRIVEQAFPFWHVQDLIDLHTRVKGLKDGKRTSLKQVGEKTFLCSVMTFRRGLARITETKIDDSKKPELIVEDDGHVYVVEKNNETLNIQIGSARKEKVPFTTLFKHVFGYECAKNVLDILNGLNRRISKMGIISICKSMMQKLIRFQPLFATIDGKKIESKYALLFCIYKILYGNSQYLPNLHRSVQGPENVAKRLAVIAFEDSDPRIIEKELPKLLGAALLSQVEPTWFPTFDLIVHWCNMAMLLLNAPNAIYYETKTDSTFTKSRLFDKMPSFSCCAWLIKLIGSFRGDINMVAYQAWHRSELKALSVSNGRRPTTIVLPDGACDQHTNANIVLLMDDSLQYPRTKTILGGRTKFIFSKCTGINPRRQVVQMDNILRSLRNVQKVYVNLFDPPKLIPNATTQTYHFQMDDEMLAGALGAWKIGKFEGIHLSASLDPSDLNNIVVSPTLVTRGAKMEKVQAAFEDEAQKNGKKKALEILQKGLKLNKIDKQNLPIPIFNWEVKKTEDGLFVLRQNEESKWVPWNELKKFVCNYATCNDDEEFTSQSPYTGNASESITKDFLQGTPVRILQRALTYIRHYKKKFKMASVDRSGGTGNGSEPIDFYDPHVFKFFLNLSRFVPYALRPSKPFEFKVENPWFLHSVSQTIQKVIDDSMLHGVLDGYDKWDNYVDREERTLYDFQSESIARMRKEDEMGKLNHFLRLPVGYGKTLIALTYLSQRGLRDVQYIVYTMPKTAFGTVIGEMVTMGFTVRIFMNYQKSKSKDNEIQSLERIGEGSAWTWDNTKLRPKVFTYPKKNETFPVFPKGTIIVVEHDGLRKYKEQLLSIIPNAFIIFDEVHKCLLNSLRTGVAILLARLSKGSLAFTGTPILNSNGAILLIKWLENCVKFPINEKNFVVATNAMISYTPRTKIKVQEEDIHFDLDTNDMRMYSDYVKRKKLKDMVSLCHNASLKKIVEVTCNQIREGRKVFVVGKTKNDQNMLGTMLLKELNGKDIACIDCEVSGTDCITVIDLTDEKVEKKEVKDYDIVIGTEKKCTGYNLTRLNVMVSGVYFGNEANRTQIRGRINRLSQNNDTVYYFYVHTGVLSLVYNNHNLAKIASQCIQSKKINQKDMDLLFKTIHA